MTITAYQLILYMGGMALLWATPGPVWVAIIARTLAGGFAAAWPLAVGVVIGDLIWPLCAIFGLSLILSVYEDFLTALQWVAAATFCVMGILLIRQPTGPLVTESRLTKPGLWPGFLTGVAAVLGNPKAILFYMGVLPGFFDLGRINGADIGAILFVSALVPLLGNLVLALFVVRARKLVASPQSVRRVNVLSGVLLIGVGLAILAT